MRYRLRSLLLATALICVAASYFDQASNWWMSQTRPSVTFVGNSFESRELAALMGISFFGELTPNQTNQGSKQLTDLYRKMGYLEARVIIERSRTNLGWATRFIIQEGTRCDATQVSKLVGETLASSQCPRHGEYLCLDNIQRCPVCQPSLPS